MSRPSTVLRAGAAARAGLLVLVLAAADKQTSGAAEEARFAELLARRAQGASSEALDRAARELAGDPAAVPGYLALASGRLSPAAQEQPGPEGETSLLGAEGELLARIAPRLAPEAVVAHVGTALERRPGDAWRAAALGLLAMHARGSDLGLLVDTVGEARPAAGGEPLLEAFRAALIQLLKRDGEAFEALAFLGVVPVDAAVQIVRAIGQAGDPRGLTWLVQQLGDVDLTAASLQELERLAPRAPPASAAEVADAVRPFLWADEVAHRRHAMGILAALCDADCAARLIEILESARGSEQRAAHAALRALSGRDLPAVASAWRAWQVEEARWWEEESAAVLEDLASESPAVVLAAVRSVSARTLHRERLARELAKLANAHPSAEVRGQACAGLGRLGSPVAAPELAAALDDEDALVRARALQALQSIKGWSRPGERPAAPPVGEPAPAQL